MNNKFLKISINLLTNFKPNVLKNYKNINFRRNKINKVCCRNFLIYILLIKFKNLIFFKKLSIFVKKQKKNTFTILRAPYRHKLSRHQIFFQRYDIFLSIFINVDNIIVKNNKNILNILKYIKNINKILESNLIYIKNIKIDFKINYINLFLLKKYKNKLKINDYFK